jgi:hypothetical protein
VTGEVDACHVTASLYFMEPRVPTKRIMPPMEPVDTPAFRTVIHRSSSPGKSITRVRHVFVFIYGSVTTIILSGVGYLF